MATGKRKADAMESSLTRGQESRNEYQGTGADTVQDEIWTIGERGSSATQPKTGPRHQAQSSG